jgi:hypothetical protein
MTLDAPSQQLLDTAIDGLFLGVLNPTRNAMRLFEAAPWADVSRRRFPDHQSLVRHRLIDWDREYGFSFEIAQRKVTRFNRLSLLNHTLPDSVIGIDIMIAVIAAVGLESAPDFRVYPEAS